MADRRPGAGCAAALVVTLLSALAAPATAVAQESRADEIARLQAQKASKLRPYERSAGERVLDFANRMTVGGEGGVYPWIGSVYPGGMLAGGAGYRRPVADTGDFNLLGAWSLRNYKLARADFKLPEFGRRRLAITTRGMWLDAPSVAFYGVGNQTARTDRVTYEFTPTTVAVDARLRLTDWMFLGGGADYLAIDTGVGSTPVTLAAPGLGADVSYLIRRATFGIDWRTSPGYARRGGLYRIEWAQHDERDDLPFGFRQTEAEIIQMLPLLRQSSVIALRALVTTTEVDDGEVVPVFMLPSLGGGTTMRGYPSWRFRDRHRLLFSGEYRWTPAQVIDMALFMDAGKVAAERRDLDFDDLKTNFGIGIRLHGPSFTAVRLDLARGREGWVLNLGGGAAF